ncbi:SpoIIE family protein phosphatase [Streptomyces toxytricini]|uniref:SpoIIE family protein phosphatase n=1 Tax=Streptomyces toxytricini TaxID=67369 RepID=A0ABW8EE15_STRT5
MGVTGEPVSPVRSRERFLLGEPVETGVRSPILHSWERCRLLGLSPDQTELPYRDDFDPDSRLVRAARPVLDQLAARFAGSRMNVSLADAAGTVLQRRFGEPGLARSLPPIQTVPGFVFAERFAGTNGIGLALAERCLVQVYGAEHFAERSQSNACCAVPVRNQLNGLVEGVLCFGYPRSDEDPALTALIRRAAESIERRLTEQTSQRERALLRSYLDARAHAGADGRPAGAGGAFPYTVPDVSPADPSGALLDPRDESVLKERAAELISSTQRAAVEVTLLHGRRATLLSRPVTSGTGIEGIAVEAVLTDGEPGARRPTALSAVGAAPAGTPAAPPTPPAPAAPPAPQAPPGPPAAPAADRNGAGPDRDRADGASRRLVLVGEPEVGRYALAARRRLELLAEASARIGTTLDVHRTARELAEVAVPGLADYVTVDVPEAVLRGEEPSDTAGPVRRTVVHGIRDDHPFHPEGSPVELRPGTPHLRCLADGKAVVEADLAAGGWLARGPDPAVALGGHPVHSLVAVPLLARGGLLGVACFYRSEDPAPFADDDTWLAQELCARAALCMDNARQYTREHTLALALQRSLLPHRLPEQGAVEVAHRYLPAESGVGGDWFDVIPLSGTRVALLVGDVVGHGLLAAATMGRLRTAARNFAELELAPDELLTHLDNLLVRLDREEGGESDTGSTGIVGATCLYVIYDPTTRECTMARAGHLPPAVVRPDGSVDFPELPAGPPLGLGGLPFETAAIDLPEGSTLVLYTDGLVEDRHRDIDAALEDLRRALAHPGRTPEDTCRSVIDAVAPDHPADDIALLAARIHTLPAERIAAWDVPADPARVGEIRAAATRTLTEWGLEEPAFAVELLLSELVTNAVRYGGEPIQVRMIHDRTLICEVSDGSSTAPHLRRAAGTDEGGRGLFLVAQLSQAWGTRYTPRGKVIWAECALDAA